MLFFFLLTKTKIKDKQMLFLNSSVNITTLCASAYTNTVGS